MEKFIEIKTVKVDESAKTKGKSEKPAKPEEKSSPLTTANWTPDIVAGGVGVTLGLTIAPMLSIALLFIPGTSIIIFCALLLLLCSWMFAKMCGHMEIPPRRVFQQSWSLLIPTVVVFFMQTIFVLLVYQKVNSALGTAAGVGQMIGVSTALPSFTPVITAQNAIWLSALIAVTILIPFIIKERKELKFKWFLPLLIPVILCAIILFILVGANALA